MLVAESDIPRVSGYETMSKEASTSKYGLHKRDDDDEPLLSRLGRVGVNFW